MNCSNTLKKHKLEQCKLPSPTSISLTCGETTKTINKEAREESPAVAGGSGSGGSGRGDNGGGGGGGGGGHPHHGPPGGAGGMAWISSLDNHLMCSWETTPR